MQKLLLKEREQDIMPEEYAVKKFCFACLKFTPHVEKGFKLHNYRKECLICNKNTKYITA